MPKVQPVSFHSQVTVYPVNDYYRTATLIYIALDHVRFRRRIERTKLIVLLIWTDVHKMTIRHCARKSFIKINEPDKGYITSGPYHLSSDQVRACDTAARINNR